MISARVDPERGGQADLQIILILDSGSTIFPIFRQLCVHPTFQFARSNADRVKIITNNLPGVTDLMRYGRIGGKRRVRTLFECRILSGFAHSAYGASLNKGTSADLEIAVNEFKQSIHCSGSKQDPLVISVITGNYVSVTEGVLARDPNHVDTKSKALTECGEAYVLAPLGKFVPLTCRQLNDLLDLSGPNVAYEVLPGWKMAQPKLTMVATERASEYHRKVDPAVLGAHLVRVQAEIKDAFDADHLESIAFDPTDDPGILAQTAMMGTGRALRELRVPAQGPSGEARVDVRYLEERQPN